MEDDAMPVDLLERHRLEPGCRTIGQLLQERQWAADEIERLRAMVSCQSTKASTAVVQSNTLAPAKRQLPHEPARGTTIATSIQLLRLADVSSLVGFSRSTIYMKIAKGDFPAGIRIGDRARRWKLSEITAWQERLGS
jgi:prophage regulatory protein